jgi:hypothetical protein
MQHSSDTDASTPRTYVLQLTDRELSTLQELTERRVSAETEDTSPDAPETSALSRLASELRYARPRSSDDISSMGEDAKRREYREDVDAIAEDILSDVLGSLDADELDTDEDELRTTADERAWEQVDSSQWVIYTSRAMDVLRLSDNDSYSVDNFGVEGIVSESGIEWSKLAFGAMYADVMEELSSRLDAWKETREEWTEELEERALSLSDVELRDSGSRTADRFHVTITLPDGSTLSYRMSTDASAPNGVCMTSDGPSETDRSSNILAADVTDAVRSQVLRIVDATRDELRATLERYREQLAELDAADAESASERRDERDIDADAERASQRSELESARESLRELAESWSIDV